ncbi:cytochrome c-type biogenesis protein CycL [Neokomagataea thailandica NBRC 106555]|uniref:Cytochrome c-type biogenesis protein n=2 Tax=Neokomagataea TaxID=1223423 RepID=A0A4Y6V735_9PROT|nr:MULTISPECIES: cytochrome c-type biogenesis protein [Neokomagataea]QDH24346.1 cytochrome c-type biogenesis protein CcmH [Neokomagataea tanensis]GBR53222.1 cytochrome c-type biogenesis protein CycL [Neokomagataea thailandica NBRC 106555]
MKRLYTLLFVVLFVGGLTGLALAVDSPSEMLHDPVQEKRAENIGAQLRCLVCQNESIEDSSAPLARDLRHVVREQVQSGKTDQEIMAWMTDRYGTFIRLSPPFSITTALLWIMPALALVSGVALAWWQFRQRNTAPPNDSLTDEERTRIAALTQENE